MMKIRVLAWLLLLSSAQSSTASGFQGLQDPNFSEPKFDGKLHGENNRNGLHQKIERRIFEVRKHENFQSYWRKVGGKGKGTGGKGGRSGDRHPRNARRNASASISALSPCFFISASVSLMLLLLPFMS